MTDERIIEIANERDEFVKLDDGFVYFWPDKSPHGAYAAHHLRQLADELDRRNAKWQADLDYYMEYGKINDSKPD